MIIGRGLIGNGFDSSNDDYSNYIIFASGVSNSKEISDNEYNREKELIIKTINENKGLKFIYFSSVLVGIAKNKYYNTKLEFEEIIKSNTTNYIIFRIPQIIGKIGNSNNLINYLKHSIINQNEITIYGNVERSLIDVDDLIKIVDYCKDKINREVLILSSIEKIKVVTLCEIISEVVNKKPIYNIIDDFENNNWEINNSKIINEAIFDIESEGYNYRVLKKYLI